MSFKNLKLRTKQRIGFAIVVFLMACTNIYVVRTMASIKSELTNVSSLWMPYAVAITDLYQNTSKLRSEQLQYCFSLEEKNKLAITELVPKIEESQDTYTNLTKQLESRNLYSEEEHKLYDVFEENWNSYMDITTYEILLPYSNKSLEAFRELAK